VSDETDEMVRSIGLELVSRLAPEELPLYPSLVSQFGSKASRRGNASSDDQILGFGTGEAVMLMTPVILGFTQSFWNALVAHAAENAFSGVVRRLQLLRTGHQHAPQDTVRLTADQLQLVRKVAEQETRRLNISKSQAGLLTDALVGALAAPPAS
jgi:hypothetical protein